MSMEKKFLNALKDRYGTENPVVRDVEEFLFPSNILAAVQKKFSICPMSDVMINDESDRVVDIHTVAVPGYGPISALRAEVMLRTQQIPYSVGRDDEGVWWRREKRGVKYRVEGGG